MAMNGNTSGSDFAYHTVEELAELADDDLAALYDLVPADERALFKRVFQRALEKRDVTTDTAEARLLEDYLARYRLEGLIPAGSGWAKIDPAQRQVFLDRDGEDEVVVLPATSPGQRLMWLGAMVMMASCLLFVVLPRLLSRGGAAVAAVTPTATATLTATPLPRTPTPTPLALVHADQYVERGERANRNFYPVLLQVDAPEEAQPRMFVIQERQVDTTEWRYEANPDVASWVAGMLVRPVIGIPWSESNAAFLASLGPGTTFTLRMNTGAELRFAFMQLSEVGREAVAAFQQTSPGLIISLLGETDEEGQPTQTRLVVEGRYLAEQELEALGDGGHFPAQMGETVTVGDLALTVTGHELRPAGEDTPQFAWAFIDLQLRALLDRPLSLAGYQWWLEDGEGARQGPDPGADGLSQFGPLPAQLSPGMTVSASVGFLVSRYRTEARLWVAPPEGEGQVVALTFEPPQVAATVAGLDAQLIAAQHDAERLIVDVRLFNPQSEAVILTADDVWSVFGFVPGSESGLRVSAVDFAPLTLGAGVSLDALWAFPWNGRDPYATLAIAGRLYAVTILAE